MHNSCAEESKHPSQAESVPSQSIRGSTAAKPANPATKTDSLSQKSGCFHRVNTGDDSEADKKVDAFAVDANDKNAVHRFLVSGRVYGYPNTTGSVFSNYRHYFYNNHPLFSIVLAYRGQPYNTKKRFIVFVCVLSFAIGLAYVVVNTAIMKQVGR